MAAGDDPTGGDGPPAGTGDGAAGRAGEPLPGTGEGVPGKAARFLLRRLVRRAHGRLVVEGSAHVEKGVRIEVAPGARVVLGDGVSLGERARIEAHGGTVTVGAGARIAERAVLMARARVDVGPGAVVGAWALVSDAEAALGEPPRPVSIGARARIGVHAVVPAGTDLAADAVVAPYEVVDQTTLATRPAPAPGQR